MKPVSGYLWSKEVKSVMYINDILLIAQSTKLLKQHTIATLDLLEAPSKLPKVPADPYSDHNIPGVRSELQNLGTQPPNFQGQDYSEGSTAPPHTSCDYSMSTGTIQHMEWS